MKRSLGNIYPIFDSACHFNLNQSILKLSMLDFNRFCLMSLSWNSKSQKMSFQSHICLYLLQTVSDITIVWVHLCQYTVGLVHCQCPVKYTVQSFKMGEYFGLVQKQSSATNVVIVVTLKMCLCHSHTHFKKNMLGLPHWKKSTALAGFAFLGVDVTDLVSRILRFHIY